MLRKIRILLAALCFVAVTLLFLDLSGVLHLWLGWVAKIQFLPAILALNVGVVAALALLTLLMGRVYCSIICPLGVFQDSVSSLSASRKGKKARFAYSKEIKWLRYGVLVLFVASMVAGTSAVVSLLAPYSSFGRIVQNLFSPLYLWGNNLFAFLAERADSYAFVSKEVWVRSIPTFVVAAVTFIAVVVLAWKNGRTYCNTICPVGTFLSFLSRFSMLRPIIDTSVCKNCGSCEKKCKASCIDSKNHSIDLSRCVACFDCIDDCKFGAISYGFAWCKKTSAPSPADTNPGGIAAVGPAPAETPASADGNGSTPPAKRIAQDGDNSRRAFLIGGAMAIGGSLTGGFAGTLTAQEKKKDGGFAEILPKVAPERETPLTPPGSKSVKFFYQHCTACQLCVAACPNGVLRPSTDLARFMQPEMSFDKGYCRPECVKCSEVCPSGAILKITPEEKTQWKIGTASVDHALCIVEKDGVECGNCARHCPVGAIVMVRKDKDDPKSPLIPAVRRGRCIGCGACETLCPSRPVSAIRVDGHPVHHQEHGSEGGDAKRRLGRHASRSERD